MGQDSMIGQRWKFKRNRGSGTFTVVAVRHPDRVTLQSAWDGKRKTISLRTLMSDYEEAS